MAALTRYTRLFLDHAFVTPDVLEHRYEGQGTEERPFLVEWLDDDERNPLHTSGFWRWAITLIMAFSALSVSFASAAFSGSQLQIQQAFDIGVEPATLSVSLFVLGFAFGPMLWAPLSELYGRQILFTATMGLTTVFEAGSCAAPNIQTLLVLRALAGITAGSAVVNTAGVISDVFLPHQRGFAINIFSSAPFLGPTLGPLCSGFLAAAAGWRWVDGLTVVMIGTMWIVGSLCVPETYAPVLLRRRAAKLSKLTGKTYISKIEREKGSQSAGEIFSTALKRPWIILALEPISLVLALYVAVVYGTLYLIFSAFPIAFEEVRGWSQSIGSLSFLGVLVGQIFGLVFSFYLDERYKAQSMAKGGHATPEDRLPPMCIGGPFIAVGLLWFAFTTYPSIHWIVPLIGSAFFGFGQVLVFISAINYIIDAYTLYAASSLAANAIMRALFGFAFPLFTTQMYANLGVQWASSIPAFLALVCAPVPFALYRYGAWIRDRSPYSKESARLTAQLHAAAQRRHGVTEASETPSIADGAEKKDEEM